jgi:hypothetical protein
LLYWDLGRTISEKENVWGSKLLENISSDLKSEFPDVGGFSITNLRYCTQFYKYFSNQLHLVDDIDWNKLSIHPQLVDELQRIDLHKDAIHQQLVDEIVRQAVAVIPWGHIREIISKVKDITAAFFIFP